MTALGRRICIITQSHLCRNPRVLKEALTLSQEGYTVTILTAIYSAKLLQEDLDLIKKTGIEYEFYSDLRESNISSHLVRFVRKAATELQSKLHIESIKSLGFNPGKLLKQCISQSADLYIAHQEMPTCIGIELIKKGYKIAFDIEDWYSEDLLPIAQKQRPVNLLKKAEAEALHKGIFCTTTSSALSNKLASVYSAKKAEVIYNVFPATIQPIKKTINDPLKLFWFSQTIGLGRGLEEFIQLLKSIETKIELHLLGNVSDTYRDELKKLMPKHQQLFFHELVNEKELPAKIATFDIGLALELPAPPSRNFTITNKFFQYIQAGLPVIASETEGQNEGFDKFKPGFKLSQNPGKEEIAELDMWLSAPAALTAAKDKAIEAAQFYNWKNESKKLIKLVKNTFENTG